MSSLLIHPEISRIQEELINSNEDLTALVCGLGSGKSVGMAWASFMRARSGESVLCSAPTNSMLTDVVVKETIGIMDAHGVRYRRSRKPYNEIRFDGIHGDILYRSGFDSDKVRGLNPDSVLVDEAVYIKSRQALDTILSRSGRGPKKRLSKVIGTTPKGKQNHVYSLLYDEQGNVRPGVKIIGGSSLDSPFLTDAYKRNLIRTYVPGTAWFDQEVLGKWVDWSGGIILAHLIKVSPRPQLVRLCRAWDTASSAKSSADFTASALLGITLDGRVHVLDVTQWRGTYASLKPRIIDRMRMDPRGTTQVIEDTQAGQVIRSDLMASRELGGISIFPIAPIGDKITRCMPFASRVAAGLVTMESAAWNRPYQDELSGFGPKCEHDDMVDASSHAYNALTETAPASAFKLNL